LKGVGRTVPRPRTGWDGSRCLMSAVVGALSLLRSAGAGATSPRRFCTTWPSVFADRAARALGLAIADRTPSARPPTPCSAGNLVRHLSLVIYVNYLSNVVFTIQTLWIKRANKHVRIRKFMANRHFYFRKGTSTRCPNPSKLGGRATASVR
jgi:hypothetical protein